MTEKQFLLGYDRKRTSTLTLDEQPGAHTGSTRKYIPGYSDSNIVFRAPTTGSDANDGLTRLTPKQTKAACDTAAGSTKKIRIVEACTLNESISKPTEMERGVSGTISSSLTAPVATWTQAATPSFGGSAIRAVTWVPFCSKYIAVGASGKIAYSSNGYTWTQATSPFGSSEVYDVAASGALIVAVGASAKIAYSTDGITWALTSNSIGSDLFAIRYAGYLKKFIVGGDVLLTSSDGETWDQWQNPNQNISVTSIAVDEVAGRIVLTGDSAGVIYYSDDAQYFYVSGTTAFGSATIFASDYSPSLGRFVATASGVIGYSTDGASWTLAATPAASDPIYGVCWFSEIGRFVGVVENGDIIYSPDGNTWTAAATPSFSGAVITSVCASPIRGEAIACSESGTIAYSTAFANTISANVAGFTIQAVQYSGTITSYNCTMKQPGTTANLNLNACRVTEAGSHISSNTATSFATLFEGDRHTTCTPAAQNDIDCNLDTVGGTWYIYNASATGFERVRDCLVTGGVIANFNVTVSGRANIQGDSENILIDAEVTTDDPKFVGTTDYKLQFQTNGYARNSLAAGRSAIYFNSAGSPRDIGAWSYVESAVSYFFAKSAVLYKGEITHEIEETVSEQQGDSGVVSVYGNANRIKEIITISYGDTREVDRAPFEYIRLLKDKGVKLILDAEWESNAGTVTVNGNQAAGVEFLTVDSCIYYNGLWVTVSGKRYWIMRASPSNTAATKLILDRPLEDAVSDNDVLTTNYPTGVGEYQFAGLARLQLKRKAPDGLKGWQTGLQLRFVRKYQ